MLNIITACSRPETLDAIYKTMRFDLIGCWYIIYDTSKGRSYTHKFTENPKVKEIDWDEEGVCGHPQINHALDLIKEGMVYILDDDNIIHPNFWAFAPFFKESYIYTWDQLRHVKMNIVITGNKVFETQIDTAMFIVPRKLIGDLRWDPNQRGADGRFIKALWEKDSSVFRYINKIMCFFNYLRPVAFIKKA
jgi:hypothetical protein